VLTTKTKICIFSNLISTFLIQCDIWQQQQVLVFFSLHLISIEERDGDKEEKHSHKKCELSIFEDHCARNVIYYFRHFICLPNNANR